MMPDRREKKPKFTTFNTSCSDDRPSSATAKRCSDRIIQLALPSLHIVSSVLKEHFKTLSKGHVDRLEKLLEQIKSTRASLSQVNFMDNFSDYDRKTIIEVLERVYPKKKFTERQTELKNLKFLPVKSSSDTILTSFDKKRFLHSSNKSDKSSTDSSTNMGSYKGIFKKAIENMNFNYKETVCIQLEGTKTSKTLNSKSVQTENYQNDYCEACSKGNHELQVLYIQSSMKKKPKLRQVHTLMEGNVDFLNLEKPPRKLTSDKHIQATRETFFIGEDVELTIKHLRNLYSALSLYVNVCLNWSINTAKYSREHFSKLLISLVNLSIFLYTILSYGSKEISQYLKYILGELKQWFKSMEIKRNVRDNEVKHREKKKRKKYYIKGYHLTNVSSIVY